MAIHAGLMSDPLVREKHDVPHDRASADWARHVEFLPLGRAPASGGPVVTSSAEAWIRTQRPNSLKLTLREKGGLPSEVQDGPGAGMASAADYGIHTSHGFALRAGLRERPAGCGGTPGARCHRESVDVMVQRSHSADREGLAGRTHRV